MTDSLKNDEIGTRSWPAWMRTLSGLGALGTIATGICIATVPGFEIRHAEPSGCAVSGILIMSVLRSPKKKTARETVGQSSGLGFLIGMVLPGVTYMELDLPIEDPPLLVVIVIFVGTPFVLAALAWVLAWAGVKRFGRPCVECVNAGLLLMVLAIAGGATGYVLSDGNAVISALFGIWLLILNALLFYSRRKYMLGTDPNGTAGFPVRS